MPYKREVGGQRVPLFENQAVHDTETRPKGGFLNSCRIHIQGDFVGERREVLANIVNRGGPATINCEIPKPARPTRNSTDEAPRLEVPADDRTLCVQGVEHAPTESANITFDEMTTKLGIRLARLRELVRTTQRGVSGSRGPFAFGAPITRPGRPLAFRGRHRRRLRSALTQVSHMGVRQKLPGR